MQRNRHTQPLEQSLLESSERPCAARDNARGAFLDPTTRRIIQAVGDLSGATCLQIGACSSITPWLAERVGPLGCVMVKRDVRDEILPCTTFDLIHARSALAQTPRRDSILRRLADMLMPGGLLLVEESFDPPTFVVNAPSEGSRRLLERFQRTLNDILDAAGHDRTFALRVHDVLRGCGLTDVRTSVQAEHWSGDEPGRAMIHGFVTQWREALLRAGLTPAELHEVMALSADPRVVLHGYPFYATSGQRDSPRSSFLDWRKARP